MNNTKRFKRLIRDALIAHDESMADLPEKRFLPDSPACLAFAKP
jgi:hypothetical protein